MKLALILSVASLTGCIGDNLDYGPTPDARIIEKVIDRVEYVWLTRDAAVIDDPQDAGDSPDQWVNDPTGQCSDLATLWGPSERCPWRTLADFQCPRDLRESYTADQNGDTRMCFGNGEVVGYVTIRGDHVRGWSRFLGASADLGTEVQCSQGWVDYVRSGNLCVCWGRGCEDVNDPYCVAADTDPPPRPCTQE